MRTEGDPDIHLAVDVSDQVGADGVRHISVSGDLDLGGAEVLDAALDALDGSEALQLDLSGIDFVDSSGIRALIVARTSRPVTLVEPSRAVLHTFEIANAMHLLEHA